MDTNIAFSECLQPIENFGGTIFQNLCDGTTTYVPWGAVKWGG